MINQHVKERYFTIGILLLQFIGIPTGIYSAPFYANLYLYGYEAAFISDRIIVINVEPSNLRMSLV